MNDSVAVVPSPYVPSQVQTQAWPGADAWSLEFTLPKMNVQTTAPWRQAMAELRGMQNVFQIGDHYATAPQGSAPCPDRCHVWLEQPTHVHVALYRSWTPTVNILLQRLHPSFILPLLGCQLRLWWFVHHFDLALAA